MNNVLKFDASRPREILWSPSTKTNEAWRVTSQPSVHLLAPPPPPALYPAPQRASQEYIERLSKIHAHLRKAAAILTEFNKKWNAERGVK